MKSVLLFVAVFCVATAGSVLSQVLGGQSPVAPRPDGFVFCSDHDNGQPVPLYGRCQKRQIGSLNCGEKVTVVARNGDVLRIIPASERAPRFVDASAISRQPDKFVPFDNDSGVPDRGPIDCSAAIERRRGWMDLWYVRRGRTRCPHISVNVLTARQPALPAAKESRCEPGGVTCSRFRQLRICRPTWRSLLLFPRGPTSLFPLTTRLVWWTRARTIVATCPIAA